MHERGRGKQGWKAEGKSKRVVDSWLTTTLETSSQLLGLPVALAALLDLQEANICSGEDNSGKIIPSDVEGYVLLEEFGNGLLDLGREVERGAEPLLQMSSTLQQLQWFQGSPFRGSAGLFCGSSMCPPPHLGVCTVHPNWARRRTLEYRESATQLRLLQLQ